MITLTLKEQAERWTFYETVQGVKKLAERCPESRRLHRAAAMLAAEYVDRYGLDVPNRVVLRRRS